MNARGQTGDDDTPKQMDGGGEHGIASPRIIAHRLELIAASSRARRRRCDLSLRRGGRQLLFQQGRKLLVGLLGRLDELALVVIQRLLPLEQFLIINCKPIHNLARRGR